MKQEISGSAWDGGVVAVGTATSIWGAYAEPVLHGLLLVGSLILVGLRIAALLRSLARGRSGEGPRHDAFSDAFTALIGNEGGYSNDPKDPGGETMWGITARVARKWGYTGAMKDLPLSTAMAIAKVWYWDKVSGDLLPPVIAFQLFDIIYNGGDAAEWLQRAVGVKEDGNIGPVTLAAVNATHPAIILCLINAYRLDYWTSLKNWGDAGKGWARRASANLKRGAAAVRTQPSNPI